MIECKSIRERHLIDVDTHVEIKNVANVFKHDIEEGIGKQIECILIARLSKMDNRVLVEIGRSGSLEFSFDLGQIAREVLIKKLS